MQDLKFFLDINPPTATAQEKHVKVVSGRPIFYDPAPVKEAKKLLEWSLSSYKPSQPFSGPVELAVLWLFPRGRAHKDGEWRTSRPDTDNLTKMLKDCMTRCGFWKDDALVVRETAEKRWAENPVGIYISVKALELSVISANFPELDEIRKRDTRKAKIGA